METYHLNIFHKEYGNLWQEKSITSNTGLILDIYNEPHYKIKYPIRGTSFTQVSIDKQGNNVIAGDQSGCIYAFDIERNRFWLICQLCHCCSAIAFTEIEDKDVLVAITDARYSLYLFNSKTKKEISVMRNHKTSINYISVDDKGQRCLSSSVDLAVLWDLKTYTALHHLTASRKEICKAIYIPFQNEIAIAFKDGNLFLWESTTLRFQKQLHSTDDPDKGIKSLDVSSDGFLLVAGNRKDKLLLWNMNTKQIACTINVSRMIESIKQVTFMPLGIWKNSDYILGVIGQDGCLHIYDSNSAEHLFEVQLDNDKIRTVSTSEYEHRFAAVSGKGHILLFDLNNHFQQKRTDLKTKRKNIRRENLEHFYSGSNAKKWKQTEIAEEIPTSKLRFLIKKFGVCPEEYRFLIWFKLLKLPGNYDSFEMLIEKGEHPLCAQLCQQISQNSASDSTFRALQRLLSALLHWCPFFGDSTYIPLMIFPFVKIFHSNLLNCFEVILSVLCNWYQNWFLYFPLLPVSILSAIENLLAHHDKQLLQHFANVGVKADLYAWTLLQNSFSKILPHKHWLHLWDHIFSNNLSFMLFVVISFNIIIRNILIRCTTVEEMKPYFDREANISAERIIHKAYILMENTPFNLKPDFIIGHFMPLPKGTYPIFTKFPKDSDHFKAKEEIYLEELDYLQKRKTGIAIDNILYEKWRSESPYVLANNTDFKVFNLLKDYQLEKRRRKYNIDELESLETRRRNMLKNTELCTNNETDISDKENEMQRRYEECKMKNLQLLIQRKLLNEEFLYNLDTTTGSTKIRLTDWYQKQEFDKPATFVKSWFNLEDKILALEKEEKCIKDQIHYFIQKLTEMKNLTKRDSDAADDRMKENHDDQSKVRIQSVYHKKRPVNQALEIRRKIINQEKMRLKENKST
ncbi:TBC1 domain family member 31 isoform X1 [Centruroides vittatus]|uniref:TBC1 domain family member 31 isoform X1 n=1 Tax=Centruroides vittatus TaxID=120091 RepID=UPI00350F3104